MTDDSVPVYYTNTVNLVTTFFDVQLHLRCQTQPIVDADVPVNCIVVMAPEHARALVTALTSVLVEYEANHGAVRALPPRATRQPWEERG